MRQGTPNSGRWFLIAAAVIACIAAGFVYVSYRAMLRNTLEKELAAGANFVTGTTYLALKNTAALAQRQAQTLSQDPEIQDMLLKAEKTLAAEGPTGKQTAAAQRELRDAAASWLDAISRDTPIRSISFLLGVKTTLFLRLDRNQAEAADSPIPVAGDETTDPLAGTIIGTHIPLTGFVAGRDATGVRGGAPVLVRDREDGVARALGAVIVGAPFAPILDGLKRDLYSVSKRETNFAIALNPKTPMGATQRARLAAEAPYSDPYLLGASTDPLVASLFKSKAFRAMLDKPGAPRLLFLDGTYYGASAMRLHEDEGVAVSNAEKPARPGMGDAALVAWTSIPEAANIKRLALLINVALGGLGFSAVVAVLALSWRFAARRLQRLVDERTRQLAEANLELQRAEQRYRGMYENAVQGMFHATPAESEVSLNPAYVRMLGYDSQEEIAAVLASGGSLLWDGVERERLMARLQETGVLENAELKIRRKDGSPLWALVNARLTSDEDGQAVIEGIVIDNTARRQAEDNLRRSEEKYRRIIETAAEGFMLLDREGVIRDVNAATCVTLQYEREELLGRRPADLADAQTAARIADMLPRFEQGEQASFEGVYQAKDGRAIPVYVNTSALRDDQGEILGRVAFVADMTERNRAQALREEVERITRHDLKTPLNVVLNMPELLLEDDNLTPEQQDNLREIQAAGYRMLKMVNLSLDLYKMEKGSYVLTPRPVDVVFLCKRVWGDLGGVVADKRLGLAMRLDGAPLGDGQSLLVQGEDLLCYTMFANLLKNAVEASPEGESIEIRLRRESGGAVEIRNKGAVPEALRPCFFEKYATAGKQGGTGLGTYSARLIARTQGGDIVMASSEEEGTSVTVFFREAVEDADPDLTDA